MFLGLQKHSLGKFCLLLQLIRQVSRTVPLTRTALWESWMGFHTGTMWVFVLIEFYTTIKITNYWAVIIRVIIFPNPLLSSQLENITIIRVDFHTSLSVPSFSQTLVNWLTEHHVFINKCKCKCASVSVVYDIDLCV